MLAQLKGFLEDMHQRPANLDGVFPAGWLLENDRELVTTRSRHGVGAADPAGKQLCDALQQKIAHGMSERVVHMLEAVEVDHQQSGRCLGAAGPLQCAAQSVFKEPAVGQSGQVVVQRQMPVVFDLVFEEEKDHSHRNNVLGQVPHLALNLDCRPMRRHKRRNYKHRSPRQKSGNCDESAGCHTPVGVPEMDGATKIHGEQHSIQSESIATPRLALKNQEKDRETGIESHKRPA